ncbi:MAG: RnfABCDGE type electron transport complex subunit A [Bacillota bacterium]|nr:RnfABCDGE type electron transport complex subunit A [Bacillota bacterium]
MKLIAELFSISLGAILVENFVLVRFMGICPFLGVSKKVDTAVGMGLAVTFVMGLSTLMTHLVQRYVLEALGLEYLQTIVFILIIAALVQFVEMFLQKSVPALYASLGIYLPLITTNCAVLGVAIYAADTSIYTVFTAVWYGVSAGLGFLLAIVLLAGIRERLETSDYPKAMEGFPVALISAALLALAFMGFSGFNI